MRSRFTDRMPAQILFAIPLPLAGPPPTPLRRLIMITLTFFIACKDFTIVSKGSAFSGRTKVLTVSRRSLITSRLRLGRRKYCRSKHFPCGVRARWWKRPYTESPSFEPDEPLAGPWLWVCGCDSDCKICKESNVSALMNLKNSKQSRRVSSVKQLTWYPAR